MPQCPPEEQLGELLGELGEPVQVLERALAGLGVPRAQLRDERLEQVCLVAGRGRRTCAGGGGRARRRSGGRRRRPCRRLPRSNGASSSPYSTSSRAVLRGDAGALAELVEVDRLRLVGGEARAAAPALLAGRRGELLADHAQRQELVALEPEDRLQPLDVLLAEQPVSAARPLRREEALILEVADLRDRDVRELGSAAAGRPRRSCAAGESWVPVRWSSSGEEDEAVLADLDLVAVLEIGLLDPVCGSGMSRSGCRGPRS